MWCSQIPHHLNRQKIWQGIVSRRCFSQNSAKNLFGVCESTVKQYDYDNYIGGMLLPRQLRPAYYSLRAYNVEIALIKDQSHGNVMTSRIRFQWWRDVLESIYNGPEFKGVDHRAHPLASVLETQIANFNLSRSWFERSLEARYQDMFVRQMDNLNSLELYCEQAHSSMLYLMLETQDITDDNSMQLASHLGVAYGITLFLRSIPTNIQEFNSLPNDLCEKHQFVWTTDKSYLNSHRQQFCDVVYDIASQGHAHYCRGIELLKNETSDSRRRLVQSLLLPQLIRSKCYFEQLEKSKFDTCDASLNNSHLQRVLYQFKLLKSHHFPTVVTKL